MPRYTETYNANQMREKVDSARSLLGRPCRVCPHYCDVDRLKDQQATCRTGRWAKVSSYVSYSGTEERLRGWKGSGTIFFSDCNLRCAFCQKPEISSGWAGKIMRAEELAQAMLDLQSQGCHNLQLVNPSHVVPQIVEALELAVERGLHLPLIYSSCGFDSPESLAILEGLIDIYAVEFKFWDRLGAEKYTFEADFAGVTQKALREMHRQVGDLQFDGQGLAVRGLLVRHLVLPHDVAATRAVMRFLADELSPDTYVNLLASYEPACGLPNLAEINRAISHQEYMKAVAAASEEGIRRLDTRESWF